VQGGKVKALMQHDLMQLIKGTVCQKLTTCAGTAIGVEIISDAWRDTMNGLVPRKLCTI
jgi:hypothetical protein